MIPFDLAEIIRETEERLIASSEGRLFYTHLNTNPIKRMEDLTKGSVWKSCLDKLEENSHDASPSLAAEKVVSRLIRKGVRRDMINYHNSIYRIPLDNNIFILHRSPTGIAIQPFTIYAGHKLRYLCVNPDLLVDLILQFDAVMPEIRQVSQRIYEQFRKEEIEREIKEIVRDAQCREMEDEGVLSIDRSV